MRPGTLLAAAMFAFAMTGAAHAGDDATYTDRVGDWRIFGHIHPEGTAFVCSMQRPVGTASKFTYSIGVTGSGGRPVIVPVFALPTDLPDGSRAQVTISFDGKEHTRLAGRANGGVLQVEVNDGREVPLGSTIDLLQSSRAMTLSARSSGRTEATTVDLSGSTAAMDRNVNCFANSLQEAVRRLERGR